MATGIGPTNYSFYKTHNFNNLIPSPPGPMHCTHVEALSQIIHFHLVCHLDLPSTTYCNYMTAQSVGNLKSLEKTADKKLYCKLCKQVLAI